MSLSEANPVVAKLSHGARFEDADRERLDRLIADPIEVDARRDLICEGEDVTHMRVVLSGWACRYKLLPDGRRAIVGLLLPGDICDLPAQIVGLMDHSIATIDACAIARVPHDAVLALLDEAPAVARALWWSTLVDESILRQWLTNRGQLRADQHMTHFFCELHARLTLVGHARGPGFAFPLTQEDLADALGIATVHAHRVLQTLRRRNVISIQGRRIDFPDHEEAIAFAAFDPSYLHLRQSLREGPSPPAVPH